MREKSEEKDQYKQVIVENTFMKPATTHFNFNKTEKESSEAGTPRNYPS